MSAPVARRYFARGKEQLRAGDLDAAAQSFAAAVELAPYFVEARVGAALTLARTDPPRAGAAAPHRPAGLHARQRSAACCSSRSATCSPPAATFPAPTRPTRRRRSCPAGHPLRLTPGARCKPRPAATPRRWRRSPRRYVDSWILSRMTVVLSTPPLDSAARTSASQASSSEPSAGVGEHLLEHPVVDHVGQAVAAEQVHVARLHGDDAMIDLDLIAQPDGAHDHVRVRRPEARRQLGVVLVQVDERVVARDLLELALPQAVDARVTDVRQVQQVVVLADGDDGGAHVVQRRIGLRLA